MKKLLAFTMALVLFAALLPTSVSVKAESVTAKPFYALNGKELWEQESNVYTKVNFNTPALDGGKNSYLVSAYGAKDIKTIAQKLKEDFDTRPEGTRYIMSDLFSEAIHDLVEHNVYYTKSVKTTKGWFEEFLAEYSRIGGKLDGITIDVEYVYDGAWYIHLGSYNKLSKALYNNPNLFADIVADPRYKTEIRPLLEERGFPFQNPTGTKTEIHGIHTQYSAAYEIWNNVMSIRKSKAIDEAIYEPLVKYFPNATLCDYQVRYTAAWQKDFRNQVEPVLGNRLGVGAASSFNAYSVLPNNAVFGYGDNNKPLDKPKYNTPAAYNDAYYAPTAFNRFLWESNLFKNMHAATPSGKVSAHVTFFNYSPNKVGTYSNTPYYAESIFHIGMLNPEPLMSYIIESEVFSAGDAFADPNVGDYGYVIKVLNDIMAELTRVAGASDRKPIAVPANWNGDYVLSGMYAGGRNIWRITPDTYNGMTLEQFKVKDKAPTFSIGGQTVIFPQGRIIEDGSVRQVGTCGYWVETPADVMPVIINDTDRYSKNPSLLVNFENYEAGTALSSDTALPKASWETSGNAAKVQTVEGGKALALTGTSMVKSVKLPENITAADTYAKQQVWEVKLTVPASGKVSVLGCTEADPGLEIEDGKVYYLDAGQRKEISGVTLTAGNSYIFQRKADFTNANVYSSAYAVLDTAGNVLGSVENASMQHVALPVKEVVFRASGVTDAAYIDDFKMYPTGVATDLEAYNVTTGYKLDGLTANQDTAYRLSWMNASNEHKVAKVYNNGTLVETVSMAPGQDGVNTGIVKGGNIQLSVVTEAGTAPTVPDYDSADYTWTSAASAIGLATGKIIAGDETPVPTNPDGTPVPVPTEPDGTPSPTYPNGTPVPTNPNKPGVDEPGLASGEIILIVALAVMVLLVGGFSLCYFVIKPKWLMKFFSGEK